MYGLNLCIQSQAHPQDMALPTCLTLSTDPVYCWWHAGNRPLTSCSSQVCPCPDPTCCNLRQIRYIVSRHKRKIKNVISPLSSLLAPKVGGHVMSDPPKGGKQGGGEGGSAGVPTLNESLVCSVVLVKLLPLSRAQFPQLRDGVQGLVPEDLPNPC